MHKFYFICAIIGGAVFFLQFLLGLVGHGDSHDIDGHVDTGDIGHDTNFFTGILSLRAVVAGLAVFGLMGMFGLSEGWHEGLVLLVAVLSALATMLLVAIVMRSMLRLHAEGTIRLENAVGRPGTVYLGIPAGRSGLGKVTLTLQGRTVEFQAVTPGPALNTGAKVNVTKIIGADTVEVEPAITEEKLA
jgi:hypothetical protein